MKAEECYLVYINLLEELNKTRKEEKTINDLLALMPAST